MAGAQVAASCDTNAGGTAPLADATQIVRLTAEIALPAKHRAKATGGDGRTSRRELAC
jgi:hypothetical protein